jgi:methionine--tRNA ligase beta chain
MDIAPVKEPVAADFLERIDIRVGTIIDISDVPSSDRLVNLQVDFGDFRRRVIVGMKQERSNPTEILGRQALFVVNVEARRIRGVLSEAMLFDIGYADHITPVLAVPEKPVPNGTRAG